MGTTQKPNDWSDTAGWDKYYADLLDDGDYIADISDTGSISLDRIPQLVGELKAAALLNVWVSG